MLTCEKILVTGVTGQIGFPLAEFLAEKNEVWGLARFSSPEDRARCERAGIVPFTADLAHMNISQLPDDFSLVLHLALYQDDVPDYDYAITVNVEATGLLLSHCASARAALVMSSGSVYKPNDEPLHKHIETDALGDAQLSHAPTYSVSKIGQEAVARYCSRALALPVIVARMNVSYGANGGLPAKHLDQILAGQNITLRSAHQAYTPISQEDINAQVESLINSATTPANIVNWGGDEVVTANEWCKYLAELAHADLNTVFEASPGKQHGTALDSNKRRAITGPCRVGWQEGMQHMYFARSVGEYPESSRQ